MNRLIKGSLAVHVLAFVGLCVVYFAGLPAWVAVALVVLFFLA